MARVPKAIKIFLILGAVGLLMVLATGTVIAATVARTGVVVVSVEEKGPEGVKIYAPIPAAVIHMGLDATRVARFVSPEAEARLGRLDEHLDREIGDWGPAARAVVGELARTPAFTFLEVEGADETVRLVKRGSSWILDVDTPGEAVHVSFPNSLLERVINFLPE